MRFFLISFLFILWLILGWLFYQDSKRCCSGENDLSSLPVGLGANEIRLDISHEVWGNAQVSMTKTFINNIALYENINKTHKNEALSLTEFKSKKEIAKIEKQHYKSSDKH